MAVRCKLFGCKYGSTQTRLTTLTTFQSLAKGVEVVTVEIDYERCERCCDERKVGLRRHERGDTSWRK